MSYRFKVPGKLFIAGEYAVLEPNQQAIVVAVNRYIIATVESAEENILVLPEIGFGEITWTSIENEVKFSVSDPKLTFIQNAINVVNQFFGERNIIQRPLKLTITSQLDDSSGRKYGLGSSAAIVVATVYALLHFHRDKVPVEKEQLFKLSAIAHLQTQGNGSGADIAASVYGGWICYSSFRPNWIHNQLQRNVLISHLLVKKWPNLSIKQIIPPNQLNLCVGWTGKSVATGPMVKSIQALREEKPDKYKQFLKSSTNAVEELVTSFESDNHFGTIQALRKNRIALANLGEFTGVPIETSELRKLANIAEKYGSGKSSGAGGGDCGIAFVTGDQQVQQLEGEWREAGIVPLTLSVSELGASVESM